MIKVIVSYIHDLPCSREVSRMVLPRHSIAPVGGGLILGRTHGGLPARTSAPSLVVEAESDHKKIRDRYWKSQKSRNILCMHGLRAGRSDPRIDFRKSRKSRKVAKVRPLGLHPVTQRTDAPRVSGVSLPSSPDAP